MLVADRGAGLDVSGWDAAFARRQSPTRDAITRRWLTSAYPPDVEALTIWPTWDLEIVAAELDLEPDRTLVDIGCGGAAPGLWVARRLHTRYVGIDPSEVALQRARERAPTFLPAERYRFLRGHFEDIALPDGSADGVTAFDSFHFVQDPPVALRHIARALRAGGRLVMVLALPSDQARAAPFDDGSHLEGAGFRQVRIEPTPEFAARMKGGWSELLDAVDAVEAEVGAEQAKELADNARGLLSMLDKLRHVLIVGERV